MAGSPKQNCQERRYDTLIVVGQLWWDLVVVVCVCGGGAFEFVCVIVHNDVALV